MRYEYELPDDATLSHRLHWYAANYMVMKERAKRWDLLQERLHSRIRELGERNEELVEEVAVLRVECDRAWAAVKTAGAKVDDEDEPNGR